MSSCGREITGPQGGVRAAAIYLDPQFKTIRLEGTGEVLSIGSVVDFARVRVLLRRADGTVAIDTLIDFPANAETVTLRLSVELSSDATAAGELLSATMKYINATGDTVFSGGPVDVTAKPASSGTSTPVLLDIGYVGPGAGAASIEITPTSFTGFISNQQEFTAVVSDSSDATLAVAPVAFTSTDSNRVRVDLRTGVATLLGARGGAMIIAQTLTGQADTATVGITAVPTSLALISGSAQQVRQGEAFPQPIRVRANAVDGLGVAGVEIVFNVVQGQGSTSQQFDTTDTNGEAQVNWIAGDSAGVAVLRAEIYETLIGVNISGTQLSSAATALTFSANPANFTAGVAIPAFTVVVRDATTDTVTSFNGAVSLAIAGGTAGANLVGASNVNALNGVALFTGLTIDRGGAGYRLAASLPALPTVPPVQTATFTVAEAPPAFVTLLSGGGQTAPASAILPDSVKVRVTDVFNFPKAGVTVTFAVANGGGIVSPVSALTDAQGRVATRWTIGAAGLQQVTATVAGLAPTTINATIQTGGGPPVLFLGLDTIRIAIGRSRQVPIFLTNPTPSPLAVTLTMRDTIASWSVPSLVIPSSGDQALPLVNGLFAGTTWAVASSAAGIDSVQVTVDSAAAFIDGLGYVSAVLGDTVRTLVMLTEPAGPGGVTLTVVSTDSAAVLVAPGSGLGTPEPVCYGCSDLRATPAGESRLLAPLAGTAIVTIPQGNLSAELVILPFSQGTSDGEVPLLLTSPGYVGVGTTVQLTDPELQLYAYYTQLGVGQKGEAYAYRNVRTRRDEMIRVRSLDTEVVTVDSLALLPRDNYTTEYLYFRALMVGTTQIVAEFLGGVADTVDVTVYPGRLSASGPGSPAFLGARLSLQASLGYDYFGSYAYGGQRATPLTVTVTSRDLGVIRPDFGEIRVPANDTYQNFDVEAVGAGTTWVVLSAPGHAADSVQYTVEPAGIEAESNTPNLAVGTTNPNFYLYRTGSGSGTTALSVSLTSTDPSVLRVLTPTLTLSTENSYGYGRIEGMTAGTASIVASAPGIAPDTFTIQVFPPELQMGSYTFGQTIDPDSSQRSVTTYISDGQNTWYAADTVRAKLRSTNPAVLLVTDSIVTFYPSLSYSTGGLFRAIAPGTAQILVDAPGMTPDTSALLTVRPPRLILTTTTFTVGRGLQGSVAVNRTTPNSTMLPFTVTVQGTGGVTVLASADSFPIGTVNRQITIRSGIGAGPDTLIVSAAGMTPDTLFVVMANTRASFYNYTTSLGLGSSYDFLSFRMLNVATALSQAARDTIWIRLTSRDTTVLKVSPDSVPLAPFLAITNVYGSMTGTAPGKAWLVATPTSLGAADSVQVTVRPPRLQLSDYGAVVMGMQEETYLYEYYVSRTEAFDSPLWVFLTSSAPGVVSVPDSVLMPANDYYAYFQMTSGDSTGSAMVTASADGFAISQMPVFVSRSRFEAYVDEDIAVGGRVPLEVYRENSSYYAYRSLVPIPVRFTVTDTTIARMTPDTASTNTSSDYDYFEWLDGVAAGRTTVTVSDRRTGTFQQLLPAAYEFEVLSPRLYSSTSASFITPGMWSGNSAYLYVDAFVDSIWVQLGSVGGRFAVSSDSLLLEGYSSAFYQIRGITEGVDTLVVTAPGFAPDSIIVRVTKGILQNGGTLPPTIRQGDSLQVTFSLSNSDNSPSYVEALPQTFTLATTSAIQTTLGTGPISTVEAAAGQSQISFWVKALAPGSGTLTITSPNFVTHEMTFSTRSP